MAPSSLHEIPALRPLLRRIGLDEREAEIYLALLPLRVARATTIAKAAKQSRSHTYLMLRSLMEKGLVSEIERGAVLHFIAEPPERLVGYLKDREQEYRELQTLTRGALPILSSLTAPLIGAPRVTVLKGAEGIRQIYREVLTQEFWGIYNAETSYKTFGGNIATMLLGNNPVLHARDLLVDNAGAKRYLKEVTQHEEYEIRLLPKPCSFETDTMIFGDSVALFAFDDERTIVRIENKNIADSFRAWFEVLWSQGKRTQAKN